MKNLPGESLQSKRPIWQDIMEIIISALLLYLLINCFFITSSVNQSSMVPTFNEGDFIIATRGYLNGNKYKHDDVILFLNEDGRVLIKRVIGCPGDTLSIREGNVYLNDEYLNEEYLDEWVLTYPEMEITLDDTSYFVMGDNRSGSMDSRIFGAIDESQIMGIVRLRVFPDTRTF